MSMSVSLHLPTKVQVFHKDTPKKEKKLKKKSL